MKTLRFLLYLAPALLLNGYAATFQVTPNVVSNDYTGLLTFQISGLSPGESVQIVQFYDFNGNGQVDGLDLGVHSALLTDGQAALLGGATNINVLRDEDGAANGTISGTVRFAFLPELARGVGSYVLRLSSPSNHFAAVTAPFTVRSAPYSQKIQGVVKSNGTNVPNAGVALVQIVNNRAKPIIGGAADASGNYTLPAPSDSYYVIAFRPGYVMDFKTAPHLSLATNATFTTNLTLIPATTPLAGTLVDNDNQSVGALPYSQVTAFTTDHLFAIGVTDSNANFRLPVLPGSWTVRPRWQSAASRSYLVPEPGSFMEPSFDTSGGPLSGATVPLKRATALLYGIVEDNFSNAIPGITLAANVDGGAFDALGMSDNHGLYALAMDAGGGYVNVQDINSPPASTYIWSGNYFSIADGQAQEVDVIGMNVTAHFRGQIVEDTHQPVNDFPFFANNNLGGTSIATTDANGFFDLPVFGGNWQLYPDSGVAQQRGLIFPPYTFRITDGTDLTNTIVAHKATGTISGTVSDPTGGVSGLSLTLSATVDSTGYSLTAYTDSNGHYSVPLFNGNWTVSLGAYDLLSRGYNPANPVTVTVPPTNAIANINLLPIGAANGSPKIVTGSLADAYVGQPYYQVLAVTNAAQPFSWAVASGTLPDGLTLDSYTGSISGTPTTTGLSNFTIQFTDSRGSNAVSSLSINVRSAPPQAQAPKLDLPTLLPGNTFSARVTGTVGQSYTLQFSTDLSHWTDLLTTNAPANIFYLQDTHATNTIRMYRVKVNP